METTLGFIILAITLLLVIISELAPVHIENRARRYIRPKKHKGRFERG